MIVVSLCASKNIKHYLRDMLQSYHQKDLTEAGCDEAGRGCMAGPVFAAAVILPPDFHHPLLNDSKQVSEAHRNLLRPIIEEQALAWAVARVDPEEIDRINILKASFKAMHLAIAQLSLQPESLLIDGHMFTPYPGIPHRCMVKGDATFASIAAASILAKTHRDVYMLDIHQAYPMYGWDTNKGYGTADHRNAMARFGRSPHHRFSFQLKSTQLPLAFDDKTSI
jgi:ribonuclease HII